MLFLSTPQVGSDIFFEICWIYEVARMPRMQILQERQDESMRKRLVAYTRVILQ